MTSSVFPDINVWLAMAFSRHIHHAPARLWFESLHDREHLVFCRFTQLGFLRLLTTKTVMGNRVKTQRQAWLTYESFLLEGNVRFSPEPRLLDAAFRRLADLGTASPNDWADSYLAAFAEAADLRLITFDKALAKRSQGAVLLG